MTPADLRSWMAAHHHTVRGLAAVLGCSPTMVHYWRAGRRPVPPDVEQRLQALTYPYEYLTLTPGEACLLVDAMLSTWLPDADYEDEMIAAGRNGRADDTRITLLANVYDSIGLPDSQGDDLAAKWDVSDGMTLYIRLASLSDAHIEGVVRAIRQVIARCEDGELGDLCRDAGLL